MKVRARHWICADGVWKEPGTTFETDDLTELEGMVDVLSTEVRQGNTQTEIIAKEEPEKPELAVPPDNQTDEKSELTVSAEPVPTETPVTKRSRRNAKRQ